MTILLNLPYLDETLEGIHFVSISILKSLSKVLRHFYFPLKINLFVDNQPFALKINLVDRIHCTINYIHIYNLLYIYYFIYTLYIHYILLYIIMYIFF